MPSLIERSAEEAVCESKRSAKSSKETWSWNDGSKCGKKKELLIHVLGGRQRTTLVKDCKE